MTIERQHERQRPKQQPPQPDGPQLEAPGDAAEVARAAAASAADVDATPAGIEVTIRTTTSRTADLVRVVATPETPIAELMDEACNRLEVDDQSRYVLVAGGEVLADGSRPVGDLVGEQEGTTLEVRLVRKPEAGAQYTPGRGEGADADCPQ